MSSPLASLPTSSTTQNCPKGFDALADRIKKTALVYLLLLLNPLNLNTLKCGLSFVHHAADDQINDGSYQSSMLTKKSSRSKKFTCCQILVCRSSEDSAVTPLISDIRYHQVSILSLFSFAGHHHIHCPSASVSHQTHLLEDISVGNHLDPNHFAQTGKMNIILKRLL